MKTRVSLKYFVSFWRLDWQIVEAIQGGYKLSFDQLVDMHHTQN